LMTFEQINKFCIRTMRVTERSIDQHNTASGC
jgi:hypothetical protein